MKIKTFITFFVVIFITGCIQQGNEKLTLERERWAQGKDGMAATARSADAQIVENDKLIAQLSKEAEELDEKPVNNKPKQKDMRSTENLYGPSYLHFSIITPTGWQAYRKNNGVLFSNKKNTDSVYIVADRCTNSSTAEDITKSLANEISALMHVEQAQSDSHSDSMVILSGTGKLTKKSMQVAVIKVKPAAYLCLTISSNHIDNVKKYVLKTLIYKN